MANAWTTAVAHHLRVHQRLDLYEIGDLLFIPDAIHAVQVTGR